MNNIIDILTNKIHEERDIWLLIYIYGMSKNISKEEIENLVKLYDNDLNKVLEIISDEQINTKFNK